jgi:hypothetical protein
MFASHDWSRSCVTAARSAPRSSRPGQQAQVLHEQGRHAASGGGIRGEHGVTHKDDPVRGDLSVSGQLAPVCVEQVAAGNGGSVRLRPAGLHPRRDRGNRLRREVELESLGGSYFAYASLHDPDGNGWLLQEVTTRIPGREWRIDMDVASLADLLNETAEHHGTFEAVAPPHNWWDWYAAYMDSREHGGTPDEASVAAGRYMAEVKHVVVPPA